ncbi:MAG: hypothetical protein RLY14_204 [Planctomycetota bacterium]
MSRRPGGRPHGQIRRSQLLTSFGPGSMLDLPNHSVLVGGLDSWSTGGEAIIEPRLVDKLKQLFDPPLQSLSLLTPPPDLDDPTASQTGITAWQFPEWFITQDVDAEAAKHGIRARRLVHRRMLTKGKFIDDAQKKQNVVPVRFVRACRAGHIGDLDWYSFTHNAETECRRPLWMEERGTSGDIGEIFVRCECGAVRSLGEIVFANRILGYCDGNRPWLGPYSRERCNEPNRLLIRQASNAYFSQLMSVISLPDRNENVREAVETVWDFVGQVSEVNELGYERKKAKVHAALEGFTDEEVFSEIKVRRGQSVKQAKSVKQAEIETLIAAKSELGDDRPDGNFYARTLSRDVWDSPWMKNIERVVLVHRLREVVAQVGFTRFEAISPDIDGELEIGVRRASLTRENPQWLPAVENRGEGVFIQFSQEAIQRWLTQKEVFARGELLERGHSIWSEEHKTSKRAFPGLPYIMLHSFSHLLVTAVSLECGYPASSIRERIYAIPDTGYGVLLFTATSDAEGTLGGLVQVGRRIHEHVRNALQLGELCSNDPVCAQHDPANPHERRFLQGAACHGCVLISETSCEQHNEFLDRALVVPTVDNLGIEFFQAGQ